MNGITIELDGADVSHTLSAHAIFPVVGKDTARDTKIRVVNSGSTSSGGSLKLQNRDGTTQQAFPVSIPSQGVFEQTFHSTAVPGDGYVEPEMWTGRVTGPERFGTAKALACLAAQDVDKAATSSTRRTSPAARQEGGITPEATSSTQVRSRPVPRSAC